MTLTQLIVLAALQAVTEVFPLSSAAHRALLSALMGWSDVAPLPVHFSLALAILVYFWRDVTDMVAGVFRAARGKRDSNARLAGQILVAALVTIVAGVLVQTYVLAGLDVSLTVMGWVIVAVTVLLFFFDRMSMTVNRIEHATYLDAALIGLGQVVALVPGVGTIAAMVILARMLGYERPAAARFSFLLTVPVLVAVGVRETLTAPISFGPQTFFTVAAAFIAAFIALAILMAWLRRSTFMPFAIYRLLLGAAVLAVGYQWIAL